jgi:hypothetical protein
LTGRARAPALGLGGEERFKNLLQRFRRHARSHIGDRKQDVLPGRNVGVSLGVFRIEIGIARLDRQFAATVHRVTRIDGEIEDSVFDIARIDMGVPQAAGDDRLDFDRLTQTIGAEYHRDCARDGRY